jgi:hypothetical protein
MPAPDGAGGRSIDGIQRLRSPAQTGKEVVEMKGTTTRRWTA